MPIFDSIPRVWIFILLIVGVLLTGRGATVTAQTIQLLADVEFGKPFVTLYPTKSIDGRYVASVIDTIGVLRLQSYPNERRDTVAIPDSVTSVRAWCFVSNRLLLYYKSRATKELHLAVIENESKTWTPISDIFPFVDSALGMLASFNTCTVAPGKSTATLVGTYSASAVSTTRSVIFNAQSAAALKTYDSVNINRVSPHGREYYSMKVTSDSSALLCTYVDARTGQLLRTVRSHENYYSAGATGIDHIMYTHYPLGNVSEASLPLFKADDRTIVGSLAAPNVFCTVRETSGLQWTEAYDVLNRTSVLIDTIRAAGSFVNVNDVDRVVVLHSLNPFRLRVYSYGGVEGREGLACIRSVDTALVYGNVTYGALFVAKTKEVDIVGRIDGRSYVLSGRANPLVLNADHVGEVPFAAILRNKQGDVIDSNVCTSLVVRYPIVQPFTRADRSSSGRKQHGRSIGLASARLPCLRSKNYLQCDGKADGSLCVQARLA